ncbi:unnamed protein product [Cyprideis torosa]|uniref:Uncharacterized protein n=1 Tax=Cyprideis torosa TaxID=163714 RepID=A0A7R8W3U8_9CRUS|nr:unnamed protein product [Cyprideis torosa]CAG0882515.1 unnamed protein product [Cyprideis torosa]
MSSETDGERQQIIDRLFRMPHQVDTPTRPTYKVDGSRYMYDYHFKILVIGDIATGKTCLIHRFLDDVCSSQYIPTTTMDFLGKIVNIQGRRIKLQIYDSPGRDKNPMGGSYYKGVMGLVLVYDIASRDSFNSLGTWIRIIQEYCHPDVLVVLCGNKVDLDNVRMVRVKDGQSLAEIYNYAFFETSARRGDNVHVMFTWLGEAILSYVYYLESQTKPNASPVEEPEAVSETPPTDSSVQTIQKKKKMCILSYSYLFPFAFGMQLMHTTRCAVIHKVTAQIS